MFRAFAVLALCLAARSQAAKVTPVEKVIELLKGIQSQVEEEGKTEAAAYDKYACFCKEQSDQKLYQIEGSTKQIKADNAKIAELEADITALNLDITELGKKIDDLKAEIQTAVDERKVEHEAYLVEDANVTSAISAVDRAIEAMAASKENQDGKVDLEAALLQVKVATGINLMQPGESFDYTYHSNDIIATLESLRKQFIERKNKMDKEEFDINAEFESKKLGLDNQKKFAEEDKTAKELQEAEKTERKEEKQKAVVEETAAKAADQSFLDVLTADCEAKAGLWDQRSSTRAQELTALAKALEALEQGVKPNWSANKKLDGLLQVAASSPVKPSFVQLRGARLHRTSSADVAARALRLLSDAASRLDSTVLSAIVLKGQVSEDHFVKVRGLIKDLIARLVTQAKEEAEQKSFCDKEMKKAIDSRDQANEDLETAAAAISATEAEIAQLEMDIAELSKAIAENLKALAEATELRAAEKAENEKTIVDANSGKEAVDMAIKVLSTFYDANALLQFVPKDSDRDGKTVGDLAPKVFDAEYKGQQQESKGVMGLLAVIKSDFERTISTVTAEEADAEQKFQDFKTANEADTEAKEAEKKTKEQKVKDLNDKLVKLREDKAEAAASLSNAKDELAVLHTQCVEGEETYEERVAKREKEIQALKDAQRILEEWQA